MSPSVLRLPVLSVLSTTLSAVLVLGAGPAHAAPIEDYASWQAGDRCNPRDKPGTTVLASWIVTTFGGVRGGIGRACSPSTSEHEEGRAFDWGLDARRAADRRRARAFMAKVFADGRGGQPHARARRMGIMYLIWNDQMFAAWNRFEPTDYLSPGCSKISTCSATLRHRDHVHVSLNRDGGHARTSWYRSTPPRG